MSITLNLRRIKGKRCLLAVFTEHPVSISTRRTIRTWMSVKGIHHPFTIPSNVYQYSSVVNYLNDKVAQGELTADPIQSLAAKRFDRLLRALNGYSNQAIVQAWRQTQIEERLQEERQKERISQDDNISNNNVQTDSTKQSFNNTNDTTTMAISLPPIPRGLYLYGPVGTGKTMLMDLFFDLYSKGENSIRRVHFHNFMNELHQRIHTVRMKQISYSCLDPTNCIENSVNPEDFLTHPVQRVAVQIANETTVLCLDEFQVTDVGNTYILTQLLEILFTLGTVVVVTSNQAPGTLSSSYQGSDDVFFSTFLNLLQRHCITHCLDSSIDYRMLPRLADQESMYFVIQSDQEHSVDGRLESIIDDLLLTYCPDPFTTVDLHVGFQRHITVSGTRGGVGQFTFDELCRDNDYGSLEFRAIGHHYSILVIQNIPILDLSSNLRDIDPAKRFVILMDELYEARIALLCSATVVPTQIFPSLPLDEHKSNASSDTGWTMDSDTFVGDLERVKKDKPHAYKRAISRLTEMTSRKWWDRVLLKLNNHQQ